MGSSDSRISSARKIEEPRDTDKELPPVSGHHDTWPPSEDPTASMPTQGEGDTIPTPPPSSGVIDHVTIPPLPPVRIDE